MTESQRKERSRRGAGCELAGTTIDRRDFLARASSAAILLSVPLVKASGHAAVAGQKASEASRLDGLLDRIFREQLRLSPQNMTSLGLDTCSDVWARSKLNDQSLAHAERVVRLQRDWRSGLAEIDRTQLSGMDAANFDTVAYQLDLSLQGAELFDYGRTGYPWPFILSQLNGAYQTIPDFLDSQHVIENRPDAEAYLSRLSAFAGVMEAETERAAADGRKGVIPPDFVIEKTLLQMQKLRSTTAAESTLVASLVRRTRERNIEGDWGERAAEILTGSVWSSLDRQIALLQRWRSLATHDAGIWRLPNGAAYYRFATRYQTTTGMAADEIHELGLELVAELSAEADLILKSQGMSRGSRGQRVAALYKDPRFIYPNTEEGKTQLLEELNRLVAEVARKLPEFFGSLPKAALAIRRVPAAIESGSPAGYYQDGSLDGSRAGAYYINLRDTAEVPRWTLPSLTYHEGIPGHHLQGALALETPGLPMIRRTLWFTGYGEGWALYAEQLADEMGLFASDPWGKLGYLHYALFRAVRLVVDTGIHHRRWSRQQAIRYFMETMGDPESTAATEVDRYCVWPGQACSYMIGKMAWVGLREQARARLGAAFDVREFHDVGLLTGPMPLEILERQVEAWVRDKSRAIAK